MNRPVTIRQSLLRSLIVVILVLASAILATTFWGARRSVRSLSDALIDSTIDQTELKLREFFQPIHRSLRVAHEWGERGLIDTDQPREQMNQMFVPLLEQFPQVSSVLIADTRGQEYLLLRTDEGWSNRETRAEEWGTRTRWHTWAAYGETPEPEWRTLEYDPRTRPWFIGAMEQHEADNGSRGMEDAEHLHVPVYWTQPYRFFTTGAPGITASVVFDGGDEHLYIVAFDVLLSAITEFTTSMDVSAHGGLVVLTDDGRIIGLPRVPRYADPEQRAADLLKRPQDLDWDLALQANRAFSTDDRSDEGIARFVSNGQRWWGDTRPFHLTPERLFFIAVVVPEADMLGGILTMRLWIIGITVTVLVIAIWRAVILAKRYSEPIEALVEQSDRISRGVLEVENPIVSNVAEVHQLAEAHERMRDGLKSLFKLERDLQLARQIQQNTFPEQLPTVQGFDLAAWNDPADETGGDSYDVIGLRHDSGGDGTPPQLNALHADSAIMLLADATGHGIGPALSATQIRAMLRMAVRLNADLLDIAQHLNEQLSTDMPESRFITAWLGRIDGEAGTLTSFSAGQGPLLRFSAATQSIQRIEVDAPPFGIAMDMTYELQPPIALQPGDVVAVLSDGIFEAKNQQDELLGIHRVQEIIAAKNQHSAVEILTAIRWQLRQFANGRPHDDDQTAIIIKRV